MGTAAHDLEQQRDRRADEDRRSSATQCRICAADIALDDDRMHIFAEDGRRHYLQTKIRKYLHILVSLHEARLARIFFRFSPLPFFFQNSSPSICGLRVHVCACLSRSRAGRDKFRSNFGESSRCRLR